MPRQLKLSIVFLARDYARVRSCSRRMFTKELVQFQHITPSYGYIGVIRCIPQRCHWFESSPGDYPQVAQLAEHSHHKRKAEEIVQIYHITFSPIVQWQSQWVLDPPTQVQFLMGLFSTILENQYIVNGFVIFHKSHQKVRYYRGSSLR